MTQKGKPALRHSCKGYRNWVGASVVTLVIDIRWSTDTADARKYATELIALAPDVILANSSLAVAPLVQMTRTVRIVFTTVADPVGAGYVESLARPGGNITGFTIFEYSISAKWLQLLKEIAPGVTRVAVLRDPSIAVGLPNSPRCKPLRRR
jgi:putative ABC transport system substrate-binding protein